MKSLEERISRLEALQGLIPPPVEWNITTDRIRLVSNERPCGLLEAKRELIKNFGDTMSEERGVTQDG